jgi:hypothetical protein
VAGKVKLRAYYPVPGNRLVLTAAARGFHQFFFQRSYVFGGEAASAGALRAVAKIPHRVINALLAGYAAAEGFHGISAHAFYGNGLHSNLLFPKNFVLL